MNIDFDERNPTLISDLDFSDVTREIGGILTDVRDLLDLLQSFSSQYARLIASAIEPAVDFPEESEIPPISPRITENTSGVRLEWQSNEIIRSAHGKMRSIRRNVIKLADGKRRYPMSLFDMVPPSERTRFQCAEISLSKVREQHELIVEIRKFLNRYECSLKYVAPAGVSVSSDSRAYLKG